MSSLCLDDRRRPLMTEQNLQRPLATERNLQRPLVTEQNLQRPLVTEQYEQRPQTTGQREQRPLSTTRDRKTRRRNAKFTATSFYIRLRAALQLGDNFTFVYYTSTQHRGIYNFTFNELLQFFHLQRCYGLTRKDILHFYTCGGDNFLHLHL